MSGQMWFATEQYGQWIPCPRVNMSAGRVSWGTVSKYLNGGNWARRSTTAAKMFGMEWPLNTRDALRPIQDFVDGFYGTGDVYFTNPFAMDKNILPAQWAQGYLNAIDGPLVTPYPNSWPPAPYGILNDVQRPDLLETNQSVNGFPTAQGGIRGQHTLFIPVPPGYTFRFSVHAISAASYSQTLSLTILEKGVPVSTPFFPAAGTLTDPVLTGYSANITDPHRGILIDSGIIDLVYTGMMAQITPIGQSVNTAQGFKSGQGHSGLQFDEPGLEYFEYSSALDKVQASANLVEVGSWR